jgi:hypothetical protein
MKKTVHIVVECGLVRAVYADEGLDIDIEILDLDTECQDEYDEVTKAVLELADHATVVY